MLLLLLLLLPPILADGSSFSFINIACTDNNDYTVDVYALGRTCIEPVEGMASNGLAAHPEDKV